MTAVAARVARFDARRVALSIAAPALAIAFSLLVTALVLRVDR